MNQSTIDKILSKKINHLNPYFFFSLSYIQLELNPIRKEKGNTVHITEDQMNGFGLRSDFSI